MLALPFLPRFLFEINSLKSSTKFSFKKLLVNFIPASKKILEKPNFLALFSTFLKSSSPFLFK